MSRDYYERNREAILAKAKERYQLQKQDPEWRAKINARNRARCAANPAAKAEYGRRYREKLKRDPERSDKRRDQWRVWGRRRYRETVGIVGATAETRHGQCPICLKEKQLVCDHEHGPGGGGPIRGWLCSQCNLSLGGLGDTREAVQRALQYLQPKP